MPTLQRTKDIRIAITIILLIIFWSTLRLLFVEPGGMAETAVIAQPAPSDNFGVDLNAFSFSPALITVKVGDTVTWTRLQGFHNVAADDGSFRLGNANGDPGDTWTTVSHTFNTVGTFRYYCEIHGGPGGVGMAGIVVVEDGASSTTTSTATATEPTGTPTVTPTSSPTMTLPMTTTTPTGTPTATPTVTATGMATALSTSTATATGTSTSTALPTASPTATPTLSATMTTATPATTATIVQPTASPRTFLPLINNE